MEKFMLWTITVIHADGEMYMHEEDTREGTCEYLKELKESGQDMVYVNVFPPQSNMDINELI